MFDIEKYNPFTIKSDEEFNGFALKIFQYQLNYNPIYKKFIDFSGTDKNSVKQVDEIPFLPIEFFKSARVITGDENFDLVFKSSGTTNSERSTHYVKDINIYEKSFFSGFEFVYGNASQYCLLALLPNYLEQGESSLVYMVNHFINQSNNPYSGFYLDDLDKLADVIEKLNKEGEKILLIGVSYALLDLLELRHFKLKNTIVMETGGMKGRRKELVKRELHDELSKGFGVEKIHSEYGMTELLSQAYSKENGLFVCPPWMKVLVREPNDPLAVTEMGQGGGLNIIDLANVHSCSFIATQDLGNVKKDGSFEVLGRFDNSDIRGCNLMLA